MSRIVLLLAVLMLTQVGCASVPSVGMASTPAANAGGNRTWDVAPNVRSRELSGTSVRDRYIRQYLEGRELDPIEGVWVWSDNLYEVVITRNTTTADPEYDFIGIITRTNSPNWRVGEVKVALTRTAARGVYTALYRSGNRHPVGTSFLVRSPNMIEANPPVGPNWSPQNVLLIRVYPQSSEGSAGSTRDNPPSGTSHGTCFAVSANGLLATSNHVIEGFDNITVTLSDGSTVPARVYDSSAATDLAILRIDRPTPTWLELAPRDDVTVGDRVFTVGFPTSQILGDEIKFTDGTVSSLSGVRGERSLLQTTVPIQPGSSGGPLINEDGQVVGVVTSTAAVSAFFRATGSLPQNVNWAVRSEYLELMYQSEANTARLTSRQDVIRHAISATCRVRAGR